MRYRFSKGDKLLFDLESGLASFEYADKDYKSRTKAQIIKNGEINGQRTA
jgi:hypothetical protein